MFRENITYSVTLFVAAALISPVAAAQTFPQPAGWPAITREQHSTEPIGPGVTYTHWRLGTTAGPLAISMTAVDLGNPSVALRVATHHDEVVGPGERLSDMADRVGAEAGMNGDYFDINDTGSPLNVLVLDRSIEHAPDGKAALAIGEDGRVSMGPLHWSATLVTPSGFTLPLATVNDFAPNTSATLVTRRAGVALAQGLSEIVLDPTDTPVTFRVSRVLAEVSSLPVLGAGQVGVAARGRVAPQLVANAAPGDLVELAQQWQLAEAAVGSVPPAVSVGLVGTQIVAALGGGPLLLRNGQIVDDPDPPAPGEALEHYPLSGAGISGDGKTLWLVTVDGRSPHVSVGITRPMLAALFAALGASDAMAFDSGGSAEMVVRRLGDKRVRVANVPSDGRERPIADGLFVVNTSSPSRASSLVLRTAAPDVLVGGTLPVTIAAVDRNLQPADPPSGVAYAVSPKTIGDVDSHGDLRALKAGSASIEAAAGEVRGAATVHVIDRIQRLDILADEPYVPTYGSETLRVAAQAQDGSPIWVDADAVRWTVGSRAASINDGRIFAGPRPARVEVLATAGGASARTILMVGEHTVDVPLHPERWRYAALPRDVPGSVSAEAAPDGSPGLHLSYDFSTQNGFRAAYARSDLRIAGDPLSIVLDVLGDGHGEWLRGSYRNGDGVVDTVTLARRVDWIGWRKLRVQIPADARFPISLLSLYAIEASSAGHEQGDLWFRALRVTYPGPK